MKISRQGVLESFGVDVRGHFRSNFIHQDVVLPCKKFMEGCDGYAMSPLKMPHGGVTTRPDNSDHALIVIMKQ
jgi:hypothetical protein